MNNTSYRHWFSRPHETLEGAQASQKWDLFNPVGVFLTPDGCYVTGLVRCDSRWSMEWLTDMAAQIEGVTGYKLVSYCDPIVPGWFEFQPVAVEQGGGS